MADSIQFLPGSLELEQDQNPYALSISQILREALADSTGYFGYKLTSLGRCNDDESPTFLVVTKEHGVVLVDLITQKLESITPQSDSEIWEFENETRAYSRSLLMELFEEEVASRLKQDLSLYSRKEKRVTVPISTVLVFLNNSLEELEKFDEDQLAGSAQIVSKDEVSNELSELFSDILKTHDGSDAELDKVISLIEGTYVYEDKFQIAQKEDLGSMSSLIRASLVKTFKQDEAQRVISMQLPNGPQRIRGLAGTGKTIVLSLKAAVTHKRMKDFRILYLFNTQSLYGHITSLISQYYVAEAKKAPDFENKLDILHAWGGRARPGLYSELCRQYQVTPLTFGQVRNAEEPLAYIYRNLIKKLGNDLKPIYDMVLIDEAQDFPKEVFELVYKITKDPKRIIWAYDEFQSLKDTKVKGPEELFGETDGKPNITSADLEGTYAGGIKKDFILPNCYRTSRPVLMTAHGVALGLYGEPRDMAIFDHREDWEAIGYKVVSPTDHSKFREGDHIELERPDQYSKNNLEVLVREAGKKETDLISLRAKDNFIEEAEYIAEKIKRLVKDEGVNPEDIIIVNLLTRDSKAHMQRIRRELLMKEIDSIIPGYVESPDVFKVPGSVTITTPYRAKGNESNIVFVCNSQYAVSDPTLRGRNAFFVAVTRSRGWVYITGHGSEMDKLAKEVRQITNLYPRFKFQRPSDAQLERTRKLLEKSEDELEKMEKTLEGIGSDPDFFLDMIANDPKLREMLSEKLKK